MTEIINGFQGGDVLGPVVEMLDAVHDDLRPGTIEALHLISDRFTRLDPDEDFMAVHFSYYSPTPHPSLKLDGSPFYSSFLVALNPEPEGKPFLAWSTARGSEELRRPERFHSIEDLVYTAGLVRSPMVLTPVELVRTLDKRSIGQLIEHVDPRPHL